MVFYYAHDNEIFEVFISSQEVLCSVRPIYFPSLLFFPSTKYDLLLAPSFHRKLFFLYTDVSFFCNEVHDYIAAIIHSVRGC